ncbi:hypothetical protein [Neobacillus drentensis]|uniref:hypothetical protein n=1 Tax=Neobacillus drentensis TaxID=220684 RepID=UPI002FFFFE65
MRLEYRLDDEYQKFPALWSYLDLTVSEAVARMTCEYFVKESETYVVTATAIDPDGTAVLYMKKEKSSYDDIIEEQYSHIGFEVRELQRNRSDLIEKKDVWNHEEVLVVLHSDIIYIQRDGRFLEFALDSREIDEDRKCYVYYGSFTGKTR